MLYINPTASIDCGACVSVCPAEAIDAEPGVPPKWESYVEINARYYSDGHS